MASAMVLQVERPQVLDAVGEEAVLLAHDLARHLEDGLGALVEALHQPVGGLQAVGEIGLLPCRLRASSTTLRVIAAGRPEAAAACRIELDLPAAVGPSRTNTSGTTGCTGSAPKARPGLGLSSRISAIMSASLRRRRRRSCAAPRHVAARHQIEIVEQRRHRGVEPVELAQLQGQAFGQIARADAGRIEALQPRQHRLDPRRAARRAARRPPRDRRADSRPRRPHRPGNGRSCGRPDRRRRSTPVRSRWPASDVSLGDEGFEIVIPVGAAAGPDTRPIPNSARAGSVAPGAGAGRALIGNTLLRSGVEPLFDGLAAGLAGAPRHPIAVAAVRSAVLAAGASAALLARAGSRRAGRSSSGFRSNSPSNSRRVRDSTAAAA